MKFLTVAGDSPELGPTQLNINIDQITLVAPLGLKGCQVRLSCGTIINIHDRTMIGFLSDVIGAKGV